MNYRKNDMKELIFIAGSTLFFCITIFIQCAIAEPTGKLIIFHAGSLSVPFEQIEKEFEKQYPNVDVLRESGGSQKCARMISDIKKPCDIMASADFRVIDKLLIPEYATTNIRFASNQMVLCFTDKSKMAKKINATNWIDILTTKGVIWGHSDPDLDPCGYRALLVLKLAEKYYKKPGLYEQFIDNRPQENIRPKSAELVALLQTGHMDYAWEYRSVAVQHGLKYLELPAQINLSDPHHDNFYNQAHVEVKGKEPGTTITMTGQSITYGVALIKNAPNPEAAVAFLTYLLNRDEGLKILQEMGQPPYIPSIVPTKAMYDLLPHPLKKLVQLSMDEK
ncbi:MAG: tungstate ABC transporter substrate-binding protein WtpA [bacterium]